MAIGDIGSAKTAVTVKEGTCLDPFPIRVGPGVFAVFYMDDTAGLIVKTYSSNAVGGITGISTSDTVVDAGGRSSPHVIHISGTIYAVTYNGADDHGHITTVDIATDGTINDASVQHLEWTAQIVEFPFICHVRQHYYAITYGVAAGYVGCLKTISISTDGATIASVDNWAFSTDQNNRTSCFKISEGVIWITYGDSFSSGFAFSVAISSEGAITESRITDWSYLQATTAMWPIRVGPQQYALAASWADSDGWVSSLSIADNGTITHAWDDQLEFDGTHCGMLQFLSLGGIYYAVCYIGSDDHWEIATFWIAADGEIRNSNIDTFDSASAVHSHITWCWALENIYIVAWENSLNDIIITPIDIESYTPPRAPRHEMLMGIGP